MLPSVGISGVRDSGNNQSRQSGGLGTPNPSHLPASSPSHDEALPAPAEALSASLHFIGLIGRCLSGGNLTLPVSPEP